MQILNYSQTRPKLSRRAITVNIMVLVLVVLIVGWGVPTWYRRSQAERLAGAYRLIDAEIPGTEVYLRGKLLGTTPLILSKADCVAVGLPVTPGTVVEWDGWGEGVPIHDPTTNSHPRLMYKVPPGHANLFLTYETPWGSRTKMGGGRELPNGFRANFLSRGQNGVGVIMNIDFDSKATPSEKVRKVTVSATNNGSGTYSGSRPEVELRWGTFDIPWQHRSRKKFALPAEWANIKAGQTLKTTVETPIPAESGDYSIFATLNLFESKTSDYLVGQGSVYSDSKLLHVP